MLEKNNRYSPEKAQEEAAELKTKVIFNRAKDYNEAEQQIEDDNKSREEYKLKKVKDDILSAINKCWNFNFSDDHKLMLSQNLPEIIEAKQKKALELLEKGDVRSFESLEENVGPLGNDFIKSENAQSRIRAGLIAKLKGEPIFYPSYGSTYYHDLKDAQPLAIRFDVPKEEIKLPEVQEALKIALINLIKNNQSREANKAIEYFDISKKLLVSPEIRQAIKDQLVNLLTSNRSKSDIISISQLDKSREIQNDPEVNEALKVWMVSFIKNECSNLLEMKGEFKRFDSLLSAPEVKQAIKFRLIAELKNTYHGFHSTLTNVVDIPPDILSDSDVRDALKKGMIDRLAWGVGADRAKAIKDDFGLSNIIEESEVQNAIKQGILDTLKENQYFHIENIMTIKDEFGIPDEIINDNEIQKKLEKKLGEELRRGNFDNLNVAAKLFKINIPLSLDKIENICLQGSAASVLADNLDHEFFKTYKDKLLDQLGAEYYSDHIEQIKTVLSDNQDFALTKQDIDLIEEKDRDFDLISYPELNVLRRTSPLESYSLADDKSAEKVFSMLENSESREWKSSDVSNNFKAGAEVFGYKRMFEYANPDKRTGAFSNFDRVIEMFKESGLDANEFYNNILEEVKNEEDSNEGEGRDYFTDELYRMKPYQKVNSIAENINPDFNNFLEEIDKYKDIKKVQKKLGGLDLPNNIYRSWENLKKYESLCLFLQKREEIEQNYPQGFNYLEMSDLFEVPEVGDRTVEAIYGLTNFNFQENIQPIIDAQGVASFLYLKSIKNNENYREYNQESVEYITHIAKKYGTQARNILENIINRLDQPSEERETIKEFMEEVGVVHFDIYTKYKQLKESPEGAELEQLKERLHGMQDNIYAGSVTRDQFEDEFYSAVSYNVFPPAMGITQSQMGELNAERPDRRSDVPESLNELQYKTFEVSTGKYALDGGESLELEKWEDMSKAISLVNKELTKGHDVKINEVKVAEKLVGIFLNESSDKDEGKKKSEDQKKKENQQYLFEQMYRYHLSKGNDKLSSSFGLSIDELMKYKEFIGDRIKNDLVKDCLAAWKEKEPEKFGSLQKDIINRTKQTERSSARKVLGMMKGIEKQKDLTKKQQAIERLDEELKHYGLSYSQMEKLSEDEIRGKFNFIEIDLPNIEGLAEDNYRSQEYYDSREFREAYDKFFERQDSDLLVSRAVGSGLVGEINKKMRKEIDKFKFERDGQAVTKELISIISKKKEHGVAGYNMGICVTPDEQLWDDPDYMLYINFDKETKKAEGGMNLLVREGHLCLPGINPSIEILGQVDNEEIFDRMIDDAKKIRDKMGLGKLLIPIETVIHSNRSQIQEVVRKKGYATINLEEEASFSYDPHEYSFQECYVVE